MKNNQTLYAAGILGILAILYYLTQTGAVDTKSIDTDKFAFDRNDIYEIELTNSGTTLAFSQNEGGWLLENYPVDTVRMNQFLNLFSELKIDRLITQNAEKHVKYEVTDESSQVLAKSESGKDLLHVIIGKQGANYQETFVREYSDDAVFAVKSSLGQYKTKTQADFWDKSMTQIDVNQINYVELIGEMNYILHRNGPVWTFDGKQVDFEKVTSMLSPLSNLKGSNFASEITADNAFYQGISLGFEDGSNLELTFHLKEATGALLLVKVSGNDKIFEYSKSGLNRYKKTLSDLIADPPPET